MVFFVFGGIFAAAALQQIYEQAFDLPHRRIKDLPHRLAWLAVLIGASLLSGWAGPGLRHAGGSWSFSARSPAAPGKSAHQARARPAS
jgi:hypothetical protein